jgi:Tfp pilus assembly protein PilO
MNEAYEALKTVVGILIGILVAIVGWFAKQTADELKELKKSAVTRDELKEALALLREDRLTLHQENRDSLTRIEEKIDANEDRASRTRHDTNESVHALALQIAVLNRAAK